jgi:hypothetical protein
MLPSVSHQSPMSSPERSPGGDPIDSVLTPSRLRELAAIADRDPRAVDADDVVRLIVNLGAVMQDRELPFRMEDAPECVYHYCGIESFEGIVRSGEIHLSDGSFSNDELEFLWAVQQCEELLPPLLGPHDAASTLAFVAQTVRSPHIASFSERQDMLSQWRQYASDGCGFAIGVRPDKLSVHVGEPKATWRKPDAPNQPTTIESPTALVRVVYDHELQQNCIRLAWERASQHPEPVARLPIFYLALRSFIPCFKHPGFREEREWRLVGEQTVQASRSEVQFPSANRRKLCRRGIAPYTPFDLRARTGSLAVVRLGPRNPFAIPDIQRFVAEHGWGEIPMEKSTIPYRG